ncbi:MAG TPA: sulfatase-like hydrolase/transferase [Gemmataceae bacterium]|nr:sulfatase-like hydrolase/transferase [Gemmataceae bacterium]
MRLPVAAFTALATLAVGLPVTSAAEKPNIVFLLADDLGYGDLGCTGHPYAKTPAIDQLAKDGTLFHNFYVAGATCCPSRTGFMTGRFPARFQKYPAAFGFSGTVTVTDLLKRNGYRTGHFGKWHMGEEQTNGTYGIDTIRISGGNRQDPRGRDAAIADAAIDFIKANKAGPFYVNVWFHTPHNPVRPPKAFVDRFAAVTVKRDDFPNPDIRRYFDLYEKLGGKLDDGMRNYLGDVAQLDDQVARILRVLDDLGLRENTIVVFTSDNGPGNGIGPDKDNADPPRRQKLAENLLGSAGPLRDRKHSLHDGGIRLPFIIRWPGRVPAGRRDEKSVIAGVDWLPTLCALTGTTIEADKLDGEDVSDVWLGKERERQKDLFWKASRPHSPVAIRRGNWKLYQPHRGPGELYDLAKDPGERQDIAAVHPGIVKELAAALQKWNDQLPRSYEKGMGDE